MHKFVMSAKIFAISLMIVLLVNAQGHAGVVVGGTRFIIQQNDKSTTVSVRNKSDIPYLVTVRISPGGKWPGAEAPGSAGRSLVVIPPLFAIKPGHEHIIRLLQAEADLPADRESLFTLNIASIPSAHEGSRDVQIAVRSAFKLLYRPEGLKGNPDRAYREIRWSYSDEGLIAMNPTPYYVTLFQTVINGTPVVNAGVVAPFSQRKTEWCRRAPRCEIRWQTLNDAGRVLPMMVQTLHRGTHKPDTNGETPPPS